MFPINKLHTFRVIYFCLDTSLNHSLRTNKHHAMVYNIKQRRDYFMSVLMFKSIHGLVPDYLTNVITMQIEVTNRETRSCNVNNVTSVNLEFNKNCFSYIGATNWNSLPESLKQCSCLDISKKEARKCFYLTSL